MDLNYIREFVVLANTCNYMEAAEQAHNSPFYEHLHGSHVQLPAVVDH